MPATHLFLIRHGEVEDRYHRVFGGTIDMDLSPRGHEQARRLARHLRGRHFDAIYASPMKRAQQTLAPLAEHRERPPITRPELREVDFGDWTGLNFKQVLERFGARAFEWLRHLEQASVPNAEDADALRRRLGPCVRHILESHRNQSVAVVCHGGVIRVILSLLLELRLSKMSCFEIDYASVTWVEIQPHKTEVQLLNFTPWRDLP
ncbi:MAG: histidine phosphatase family protein [Verrucomicrobia bacterium]|nr:histidine phosphatase family protein [Verrucomicrobiota bacterium]